MYVHGIESNIILHRMKIIIKCGKYNENMYIHGTESNKILDIYRMKIIIKCIYIVCLAELRLSQ